MRRRDTDYDTRRSDLKLQRTIKKENAEKKMRWSKRRERMVGKSKLYDTHVVRREAMKNPDDYPKCTFEPGYYLYNDEPVKVVGVVSCFLHHYQVNCETAPGCFILRSYTLPHKWKKLDARPEEITW